MKSIRNTTLDLILFALFAFSIPTIVVFLVDSRHPDWKLARYSWQYPVVLILLIASAVGLWVLRGQVRRRKIIAVRTQAQTVGIIVVACLFIMGLWILLPPSLHQTVLVIRLYFVSVVAVIGLVLFNNTGDLALSLPLSLSPFWFFVIAVVIAVMLSALFVGRVPEVLTYDEQGELNVSYYFANTGNPYWPMYPPATPATLGFAITLVKLVAGGWMRLFGFSLTQIRLYYLVVAWLCIPFIFFAVNKLYGRSAAWIAALLVPSLALIHNIARPDIAMTLTFCISLACLVKGRQPSDSLRGSLLWNYLAGLAVTAGLEAHPYAVRYIAAIGLIYLFDYVIALRKTRFRGTRRDHAVFWSFCAGVASYAVFYIILHAYVIPGAQREPNFIASLTSIYSVQSSAAKTGAMTSNFFEHVISENIVFYAAALQEYPMEVLLLIVVVVAAIIRRSPADKLLLWLFFSSSLFGALILAHAGTHYWSFYIPFIAAFTGALIGSVPQQVTAQAVSPAKTLTLSALCTVCLLIAVFTADILERANRPHPSDTFLAIGSKIDSLVPKEAVVAGHPLYYLSMLERQNYVASENYYGEKNFYRGKELGQLPDPQAFIYTTGIGFVNDTYNYLALPYIHKANLQPAYCFKTDYGNDVILYLQPDQVPPNADLAGCTVP